MRDELSTLHKALDVLMTIAHRGGEAKASDLEQELGISRSSLYRIIGTLRSKNFVEPGAPGCYRLGFGFLVLGLMTDHQIKNMETAVSPILHDLVRKSGETAMLTAVSHPDAICVARVESPRPIRLSFEVGRRMPLCSGASGKILLCFMEDDELERYMAMAKETGLLDRWNITEAVVREQIRSAREQGYLTTSSEVDSDAFAISVPVFDATGSCRYGLSLAGPLGRFEPEKFVPVIKEAAQQLSHFLFPSQRGEEP
ncbi:IclR family transcriptional regulator [Alicyclobacillus kakegawensis]|uniref:IclR family transcriptional regulator n=1 Tax=Alicyclobacillus kakegawensis TaxID=392012 RepID=UPI00082A193C|nr:IclR family transcriptional regulator [Alicyclobacillus kakegawensis]